MTICSLSPTFKEQVIPNHVSLAVLVAMVGASLNRSVQAQFAILGDMTIGGSVTPVDNLASTLQVAFDCGAHRILIPTANAVDIATVPGELFTKFQTSFYNDPVDAVFKALGVS
jgi:ATP-dependent Lon protease